MLQCVRCWGGRGGQSKEDWGAKTALQRKLSTRAPLLPLPTRGSLARFLQTTLGCYFSKRAPASSGLLFPPLLASAGLPGSLHFSKHF